MGEANKNVAHITNYLKKAKKSEKIENFETAIEYYTLALRETDDYLLRYKRGCLYQKIGKMEKAAEDFKTFLLEDKRHGHLGTTPWGLLDGLFDLADIENQRYNARKVLSQVTFRKILVPSVPFDIYYHDKTFYDWRQVEISDNSKETSILENEPQEVAYRKGVLFFLKGKHEKAIHQLDEAINLNPNDARCYLFRSMVYALQSQKILYALPKSKDSVFGTNAHEQELNWSKFESDLERALVLSKSNDFVNRACLRTKYWLVDYEQELANQYASQPTLTARLLGFIGTMTGIILGITFLSMGLSSLVFSSLPGFTAVSIPLFLGCGILALFGALSIKKGKKLRGVLLVVASLVITIGFFITR